MHTMMKHAPGAKVFSDMLNMQSSALSDWAPSRDEWADERAPHAPVTGCCASCGQALETTAREEGVPGSDALRQGVEVLSVRAGWRRRLMLRWEDIQAFSCDTKYINVHGVDGLVHVIESSLDRVCEHAGPAIVRVHRGHAINPKYLASMVTRTDGSCEFVMQSGLIVAGSRRLAKPARLAIFGESPRRRRADGGGE